MNDATVNALLEDNVRMAGSLRPLPPIGREADLSRIATALRDEGAFVTLVGAGGVGKTTLAREHARACGGSVWIEVGTVRDRDALVAALTAALSVDLDGRDDAAVSLARAIERRSVVVLDNLEQLDETAVAMVSALAGQGRILATSRRALRCPGEKVLEVLPLAESFAVEMFHGLTSRSASDDVARAIVRRLDGVPLALELAAARVPLLGARDLLSRLDDKLDLLGGGTTADRHDSLRATIAWSWDLLSADAREVLGTSAIFEASFDAALLLEVSDLAPARAIDALEELRANALLHPSEHDVDADRPTFRLMESVRDFAREAAASRPRQAHARAVVTRAEPLAERVARGHAIPHGLAKLRADLTAIASSETVDVDWRARAAIALARLLVVSGPLELAVRLLEAPALTSASGALRARIAITKGDALRAIGRSEASAQAVREAMESSVGAPADVLADAIMVSAAVERSRGNADGALALAERARDAYRTLEDREREALGLGLVASIHQSRGRLALARQRHLEAIALHVATKTRRAEGIQRSHLAVATHRAGDVAASIALHEEALAIHEDVSDLRMCGAEHLHLGFVFHELGDPGPARAELGRAREALASVGARGLEAFAHVLRARLATDEGDFASALVDLAEARLLTPPGFSRLRATHRLVEGHLALARGDREGARDAYEESLATNEDVEAGFEVLTPAYLALVLSRLGEPARANALLGPTRARVVTLENPHLARAFDILARAATGASCPVLPDEPPSSEVRRALLFAGVRRPLVVPNGASTVVLPDGTELRLERRKNLRMLLEKLAEERQRRPGVAVPVDALLAAAWPGERVKPDAAAKRLHTAISTLRTLGLGRLLATRDDGYLLDPAVPLRRIL